MSNTIDDTMAVWQAFDSGLQHSEIQDKLGFSYDKVTSAIYRGRQKGIIAPAVRCAPLDPRLSYNRFRRGSIADVVDGLSLENQHAFISHAREQGYETIAEFLLDLAIDFLEQERERLHGKA